MATNFFQNLPIPRELRDALSAETATEDGTSSGAPKTAKYIVGNATAGDTLAVCDFLDPGDGTGLAAAFAAAGDLDPLVIGDIYLRPGIIDLGLVTSPALPLAMPLMLSLHCAPQSLVPTTGGFVPTGAMIRVGEARHIFTESALGFSVVTIENVNFEIYDVAAPVGTVVIGRFAGTVLLELLRVGVICEAVTDAALTVFLTPSTNLIATDIVAVCAGNPSVTFIDCGEIDANNCNLWASSTEGFAVGIQADNGRVVGGRIRATEGVIFLGIGGPATYFNINAVAFDVLDGGRGFALAGNTRGVVNGCRFYSDAGGLQKGIETAGNNVTITGNYIQGMNVGIGVLAAANRTLIVGNVITSSITAAIQDAGAGTITGTNIT